MRLLLLLLVFVRVKYTFGRPSRPGFDFPMEHELREYFPDGGLKTDGRCDIPTAVGFDGRPVLGPFSKKCQESTFPDGHTLKSAVFCYFPVDVGRPYCVYANHHLPSQLIVNSLLVCL